MASLFGKKEVVKEEKPDTGVDTTVATTKKKDGARAQKAGVTTSKKTTAKNEKNVSFGSSQEDISHVLLHPRITEKSTLHTSTGIYVFDVDPRANKIQIREAIKKVYNVVPVKIHTTKVSPKTVKNQRTGIKGVKSGGRKAYIYLKKGDSISIM